jgi:hypothetical protein
MSGWPAAAAELVEQGRGGQLAAAGGASPLIQALSLSKRPSTRLAYSAPSELGERGS